MVPRRCARPRDTAVADLNRAHHTSVGIDVGVNLLGSIFIIIDIGHDDEVLHHTRVIAFLHGSVQHGQLGTVVSTVDQATAIACILIFLNTIDYSAQGVLAVVIHGLLGVVHQLVTSISFLEVSVVILFIVGIVEVPATRGPIRFCFRSIYVIARISSILTIFTSVLSLRRVNLNQGIESFGLQHNLLHGEVLVTHILDSHCYSAEELVFGVSLLQGSGGRAVLHLFADAVDGLAVAAIGCKREGEEVVTFQHLGIGLPSAVALAHKRVVRVDVVHQLVSGSPGHFFPFFDVIVRTESLVAFHGNHLVHQQCADGVVGLPLVAFAHARYEAQAGVSPVAFQHIQRDVHGGALGCIPALAALLVANEIIISTSRKQRQERCCHQYVFRSHFT